MLAPSCSAAVEPIPAGFNRNGTCYFPGDSLIGFGSSAGDVQPLKGDAIAGPSGKCQLQLHATGKKRKAGHFPSSLGQNAIESHSNGYNGTAAEEAEETGRGAESMKATHFFPLAIF